MLLWSGALSLDAEKEFAASDVLADVLVDSQPLANTSTGDVYLDDVRASCHVSRSTMDCIKYRALKYMYQAAQPGTESLEVQLPGGLLRLVSVSRPSMAIAPHLLSDAEPRAGDSEVDKAFRFALRRLEAWVRARALAVDLPQPEAQGERSLDPDAPQLVHSDGRAMTDEEVSGRGKKLKLLLPLALFFKLKTILLPILLGVLVIKKMLIAAAVLLPSLLGLVKICKHHHHGHHHYSDWSSGAGSEYSPSYYPLHDSSRRHAMQQAYRAYEPPSTGA